MVPRKRMGINKLGKAWNKRQEAVKRKDNPLPKLKMPPVKQKAPWTTIGKGKMLLQGDWPLA